MSGLIVYRKTPCDHTGEKIYVCTLCMGQGYYLTEVTLEEALLELLHGNSKLARGIRQVFAPVMSK